MGHRVGRTLYQLQMEYAYERSHTGERQTQRKSDE